MISSSTPPSDPPPTQWATVVADHLVFAASVTEAAAVGGLVGSGANRTRALSNQILALSNQ